MSRCSCKNHPQKLNMFFQMLTRATHLVTSTAASCSWGADMSLICSVRFCTASCGMTRRFYR